MARAERAKILLINIHYSLKPIDFIAQTSAESSTTRYASPFAYAICMQAKVFAVQGHSYCITGVATNNYSMNFNYLAARGGELAPDSLPLDPPLRSGERSIIGLTVKPGIAEFRPELRNSARNSVWSRTTEKLNPRP